MARVTRPGGRVVVLEIATPTSRLGRAVAATWFRRVVPLVGRLAGVGSAYRYLPSSVDAYPSPEAVAFLLSEVGLLEVRWRRLTLGMVTLHVGRRA
jgi:demethylmenaquinone methyltransferase / 2-methoxy-6-polyprenyl-1,4-benzoquinol methylase